MVEGAARHVPGVDRVRVVSAPASGDDTIVSLVAEEASTRRVVVVTADQVLRARLRFERCFAGEVVVVAAPTSRWDVLARVPYQAAATLKAPCSLSVIQAIYRR